MAGLQAASPASSLIIASRLHGGPVVLRPVRATPYLVLFAHKTRTNRRSQECQNPHRNFFVPHDLDLRPFDPEINRFPRLMVKHFYVKFGDSSCIDYWDIMRNNRQTERQTDRQTNTGGNSIPSRLLSAWVNTKMNITIKEVNQSIEARFSTALLPLNV